MPTQTPRRWSPWRILLVGLLASTVLSVILVGLGVRWAISLREKHARTAERRVREFPLPAPIILTNIGRPEVPNDTNTPPAVVRGVRGRVNYSGSEPLPDPSDTASRVQPRPIAVKNAILAFQNAPSLPGDDIFRDLLIPSLQIEIPSQGVSSLNRNPRKYVRATIKEGARVYTNVAVHVKGGPGSFRQFNDTPALTVNFDKFAPGQTFHRLKKIHLNNSVQDNSYMEEKISRELFEAAGVPVPRAGNAVVTINGRDLGLYVLVEGVNKQFLKRYFKDTTGNVYDGHSQSEVTRKMPTNSGDYPNEEYRDSRLRTLADAAREADPETRLAELTKTLDLDRFLSFVAMEMILWHWDGYTMNRNNFRIFHDRDSDRMVFLPHGMDQMLSKPRGEFFPTRPNGLVSRSVLEIPECRARYGERLAQIATNIFIVEAITSRIYEVAESIETALRELNRSAPEEHRRRAAAFARSVKDRSRYLLSQVAPTDPVKFDQLAAIPLTDWHSKIDVPDARLDKEQENGGNTLLHISTESGCTASWRTTVALESGNYRLEARIKTKGVVLDSNDPRGGAGLRISRHRVGQKNTGDRDWTPIFFDFPVQEDQPDVELVCELRAKEGEVWFDLNSLRLRRR